MLAVLIYPIAKSPSISRTLPQPAEASVRRIGDALMTRFVLPLEVTGLLLTVALIGAVIIAIRESAAAPGPSGAGAGAGTARGAETPNPGNSP